MQPQISVIIVNWNTRDLLDRCVDSVIRQLDGSITMELIVVDNASADDSVSMLETKYPTVRVIKNQVNVGFANAVNQGAKSSLGRILFLLNSDAQLLDNRLRNLVAAMECDASIGIATGQMVDSSGKEIPAYYRFPGIIYLVKSYTIGRIYTLGRQIRGKVRKCQNEHDGRRICDVDWVSGGYLLVKRELLAEDGLFDKRIFMYFEDALLCKRAWDAGYRVVFVDDAPVLHECGASARKVRVKATQFSYESSRLYVQIIHGEGMLRLYETVNRFLWKSLRTGLWLLEKLGIKRLTRPKRELFEHLLSLPRIS